MPLSPAEATPSNNKNLAVAAESLFIANLTVAPGLAFALIAWLWLTRREGASTLARNHLNQAFHVSLRGGVILLAVCAVIVAFGGFAWAWTWVVLVTYFTCIHSTLLVCGCLGLAKAMAEKPFRFPLIGAGCE